MENLSLNDAPPPQSASPQRRPPHPQQHPHQQDAVFPGPPPPQGAPQLPPQMFTTAAQLLDLTDKKLLLVLRDGRKIFGVLRSWDQFANLVLTETKERYFVSVPSSSVSTDPANPHSQPSTRNLYCDIPRGTFLVRGENVLLLGEVDLDRDDDPPAGYEEGDVEEVFRIQKEAERERKKRDRLKNKKTAWRDPEGSGEVLF
ncbi:uncharacterized protein Z520_09610 [Fonsecaea multimorphosa CBS 102226]|uniref:U6 snRNA-associated Sm-like protein LSm1 n=1 Tax=Fonsecaea multimorphosa CBS 102226 TaxID=1442371 RepID=A0A0D2JVM7_9EURO|nr:uncharacterized protein Z520_09610 [Fonsecaea multimorphosa CBS 102226]KIX94564.1 hypothetical protein Z520_09610 [Fonsecaea multimorphosa CBS 102226]OAL20274.1 hypothetical protein AYO22_08986 [Fonsecaea multimorphosa]